MKPGPPIRTHDVQIDYKTLRKINPEAARKAVLEYLKANQRNVATNDRTIERKNPLGQDRRKCQRDEEKTLSA